jgi:putative ATP-binding cassette transporter
VMAMLYIIGPISIIANSIPGLIQGNIALRQLRQLLDDMPLETVIEEPGKAALSCDEIRLVNLSYVYGREDAFQIGPINLQFKRGQISFIVGGNGSGKSTLAKVISGHYQATQGEIWYDQQRINDSNLFCARQSVAAIYLDFYLFPRLFGLAAADLQKAQYYLEKLGLAHKVSLQGDRFSTIDLSDGQRKRLALLAAYLEDKNLYVFDEWAADQDPEFKRVFYTDLLPQFKRDGKIVVVISHDDRYFDQADQLIWMEHGKLLKVEQRSTALAA